MIFDAKRALELADIFGVADKEASEAPWTIKDDDSDGTIRGAHNDHIGCISTIYDFPCLDPEDEVMYAKAEAECIANAQLVVTLRNHARQASEQLRAAVSEVERLKRTERYLRYFETPQDSVTERAERLCKRAEDQDWESLAEDVAMDVQQLQRQLGENLAELEQLRGEVQKLTNELEEVRRGR